MHIAAARVVDVPQFLAFQLCVCPATIVNNWPVDSPIPKHNLIIFMPHYACNKKMYYMG